MLLTTQTLVVPVNDAVARFPQNLPDQTVIINTSASKVWVSNNPGMVSGQGVPINTQGNMVKSGDGPLYAVIDSAATQDAVLTYSSEASQVNDPVAIASATASALLAQGVPNVLTNTLLKAVFTVPQNGFNNIDSHSYASLEFLLNVVGGSGSQVVKVDCYQDPNDASLGTASHTTFYLTAPASATTCTYEWSIPVSFGSCRFTLLTTGTPAWIIYGSNRAVDKLRQRGSNSNMRQFTNNIVNPVANTQYPMPSSDSDVSFTCFNGPVLAFVFFTGVAAVTSGLIVENMTNNAGVTSGFASPALSPTGSFTFNHPATPVQWAFQPNQSGTGTLATTFVILPQAPG
jgi:hypothetical protein